MLKSKLHIMKSGPFESQISKIYFILILRLQT
jgi:hypothetical protein